MPGKVTIELVGGQAQFTREMGRGSDFAKRMLKQNSRVFGAQIDAIGENAVDRAEAYITAHYQPRSGDRRRKDESGKVGVHLHGSIRYSVNGTTNRSGNASFPFDIMLFSLADGYKVNSLNSGSKPHKIVGKNSKKKMLKMPRQGRYESYPYRRRDAAARVGTRKVARPKRHIVSPGAGLQASNQKAFAFKHIVNHPGIHASYFMENALEGAVNGVLRKNVKIAHK